MDMKHLYEACSLGERNLAHSFLLEQGLVIEDDDPTQLALSLNLFDSSEEADEPEETPKSSRKKRA